MALGLTQLLPKEDKYTFSQEFAENQIAYMMGGRCAEEVIFKQRTTGAGNDIERATELAKKMVCNWGMSEKVGPLNFGKEDDQIFLGKDFAQRKDYSESTAQVIDAEVRRIVQDNYQRALNILKANTDKLENLAKALLEFEVIDGEDIDRAMRGEVDEWKDGDLLRF
jgi:cell division protease FtsH